MVTRVVFWFQAMKASLIAFAVTLALGVLSLGLWGIGLYYVNYPLFRLWFPTDDRWEGDWVWPSTLLIGMVWPFAFILAGVVNRYLVTCQAPRFVRMAIYVLILWLWAFILWFVVLNSQPPESFRMP